METCEYCEQELQPRHRCRVGLLRSRIDQMVEGRWELQRCVDDLNGRLNRRSREITKLNQEIERQKEMRRTEREGLATWLDRRIEQQEEAMRPSYISGETKRIMEIEIAMLRRYRGIIVEGGQRVEDPLMPRFE